MKTLASMIAVVVLLMVTIGAGWWQGEWSGRWGMQPDAEAAAERLRQSLPKEMGNWGVIREEEFNPEVVKVLQCPAYISRVYEHKQTGDQVTVAVIVGPPGPISVHTPEICYSSQAYSMAGVRHPVNVTDTAGGKHVFWDLPMKKNDQRGAPMRVIYGWSTGDRWEATERPRFSFAGLPHLYKLQAAVLPNPASHAIDFDPAQDFLTNFVAQLQPQMLQAVRFGEASR